VNSRGELILVAQVEPGRMVNVLLAAIVVLLVATGAVVGMNLWPWFQARRHGAPIPIVQLGRMRLRKAPIRQILPAWIEAQQAGLEQTIRDLEAHALAGGDVRPVVTAMAAAKHAGIELDWNTARAIDLAGRDVIEATTRTLEGGRDTVTFDDAGPKPDAGG